MNDITKLPKWVSNMIRTHEMRISELEEQIREQANQIPTMVAVNQHVLDHSKALFWAPDTATVTFMLEDTEISVRIENNQLAVRGAWGRLVVRPEVSNVLSIRVEEL